MSRPRKFLQGRSLTAKEALDAIVYGEGYIYHRLWKRPVHVAFLKGIPARNLAKDILDGHICDAIINPAWKATNRGEDND